MALSFPKSSLHTAFVDILRSILDDAIIDQLDDVLNNSKILDVMSDRIKDKKTNLTVGNQTIKTNRHDEYITDKVSKTKGQFVSLVGKKLINKAPKKYSEILSNDLDEINKTLINALESPDEFFSEFTKEKIEELLSNIKNPFVDITVDKWEITLNRNKKQLDCGFKFSIKKDIKQPVVKIVLQPPIGKNPLVKIKFKISGELTLSDIKLEHVQKRFEIDLGHLGGILNIVVSEISIGNISSGQEKILLDIVKKKISQDLPKISIG